MIDNKEICYFLTPGKLRKCGALNEPCDEDTQKKCKFRMTTSEFFAARNKAVELNRKRGNCAKCKYKLKPCDIIIFEGDKEPQR